MPSLKIRNKRPAAGFRNWQDILTGTKIPRLDAEVLAAFILRRPRASLLAHPEIKFTTRQAANFKRLAARRYRGQPLAYLTGQREFYGLNFSVSPAVLVPRPETELLVERALKVISQAEGRLIMLDIGTGSGAIAVSTAFYARRQQALNYRRLQIFAIDISAAALKIAQANSQRHRLDNKINFLKGSLLKPALETLAGHKEKELLICANLPYLTPIQIKSSPSIQAEPKLALDGGRDGLKYYRELFQQLKSLQPAGAITLLAEIDPSQKTAAAGLAQRFFPQADIAVSNDLAGRARLLSIRLPRI